MKTVNAERVEIPEIVQEAMATLVKYLVYESEEEERFLSEPDGDHHDNIYIATSVVRAYLERSTLPPETENEEEGVCPECGRSDFFFVRDSRVYGACMFHRMIWRTGIVGTRTLDEDENILPSLLVRDFREVEMAIPAIVGAEENMLAECQECGKLSDWDTVGELCADCAAKC